jgi:hypothetical protein
MNRAAALFGLVFQVAVATGPIALATWLVPACSPPSNARIGVDTPNEATFAPVNNLLGYRCGSLDCHGNKQRNLVIWGCYGLRVQQGDAEVVPGCRKMGGTDTTPPELDATYRSLVGLEPAVMSTVVRSNGQNPDLLTFVRKARGEETHKGGTLFTPGDLQDQCVALWLQGSDQTQTVCAAALASDLDSGGAGTR